MAQNKTNNFLLLLALVVVVLVGSWAVYLYTNRTVDPDTLYQSEVRELQTVSSSDDTEEISDDIEATDLENLDKDLDQIDSLL